MKICVLGLWHLGSVTAAGLAALGHRVVGVDSDEPRVANLRKGMIVVAIGNHPVTDEDSLPGELKDLQAGDHVRLQLVYMQRFGGFLIQRGGSVDLTAR